MNLIQGPTEDEETECESLEKNDNNFDVENTDLALSEQSVRFRDGPGSGSIYTQDTNREWTLITP